MTKLDIDTKDWAFPLVEWIGRWLVRKDYSQSKVKHGEWQRHDAWFVYPGGKSWLWLWGTNTKLWTLLGPCCPCHRTDGDCGWDLSPTLAVLGFAQQMKSKSLMSSSFSARQSVLPVISFTSHQSCAEGGAPCFLVTAAVQHLGKCWSLSSLE